MHVLFLVWSSYPPEKIYADPSVFYRCFHPAEGLRSLKVMTSVLHYSTVEPSALTKYDFVIFFRPQFSNEFMSLFYAASEQGLTCIASYDDLFFDINMLRQSNFRGLGAPQTAILASRPYNYAQAMYFFDHFITSTDHLGKKVRDALTSSTLHVQYNAVSSEMVSLAALCSDVVPRTPRRIGYFAGGASHLPDIEAIATTISEVLVEKDAEFFCVETVPVPEAIRATGRVVTTPRLSYFGMISAYASCAVTIAPLHMNDFTRAKSGIKALEAGLAGASCVASPIPDVLRIGGERLVTVGPDRKWKEALSLALDMPISPEITRKERERIRDNFSVEIEARRLLAFLETL